MGDNKVSKNTIGIFAKDSGEENRERKRKSGGAAGRSKFCVFFSLL